MQDKIEQDLNSALKAGDSLTVSVLRLMRSSLTNARIEKGDLNDDDVVKVLQKEAKQRRDSIASYEDGGRQDLADKEKAELEIIDKYLPEQMEDAELERLIDEAIAQTGATGTADMGKVMGSVNQKVAGQAEGARVAAIVRSKLS